MRDIGLRDIPSASIGFGNGLKPVIGTRVMLSMPAQIKASPASI